MSSSSTPAQLRDRVAGQAVAPAGTGPSIVDLINQSQKAIERALPRHLNPDRLLRIAVTQVRTVKHLGECTPVSLLGGLMLSAQVGLEPGAPLGLSWLIPRFNKRASAWEATWQIGYRGIIDLSRRSGQISSISAHEVCENDEFDFAYGSKKFVFHKPRLRGERGPAWCYYAHAAMKDGGEEFIVLSTEDVGKRRARSAAGDNGPWVSDFDAMARKTAIRALAPWLPLSAEIEQIIAADDTVRRQPLAPDMAETYIPPDDDDEPADAVIVGDPASDRPYPEGEEPFDAPSAVAGK